MEWAAIDRSPLVLASRGSVEGAITGSVQHQTTAGWETIVVRRGCAKLSPWGFEPAGVYQGQGDFGSFILPLGPAAIGLCAATMSYTQLVRISPNMAPSGPMVIRYTVDGRAAS